ncbi:hypothetical protein VCHA34P120_140054 [Vibrio chagasii]|nr:hypothetical protein VCHA34P120_140054 [Vibrio chagasii]CAH7041693.1 hypothetical protein VCHA29O37_540008 [Vibrio chagasii]
MYPYLYCGMWHPLEWLVMLPEITLIKTAFISKSKSIRNQDNKK